MSQAAGTDQRGWLTDSTMCCGCGYFLTTLQSWNTLVGVVTDFMCIVQNCNNSNLFLFIHFCFFIPLILSASCFMCYSCLLIIIIIIIIVIWNSFSFP